MLGSSKLATSRTTWPAPLRQVDGAAVETERLAQLLGDGLHDVGKVERAADLLEDLDDREEMAALVLQGLDPGRQALEFFGGGTGGLNHGVPSC